MRQPPDKAERRPAGNRSGVPKMHIGGGITASITALIPIQARRGDSCWRCGAEIARTDLDALRRCAELARAGS